MVEGALNNAIDNRLIITMQLVMKSRQEVFQAKNYKDLSMASNRLVRNLTAYISVINRCAKLRGEPYTAITKGKTIPKGSKPQKGASDLERYHHYVRVSEQNKRNVIQEESLSNLLQFASKLAHSAGQAHIYKVKLQDSLSAQQYGS